MTIVVPGSIRVLMPNGRVTEMKLETYLAGAVFSEMGGSAPLEALKAQAVASRTYAASAQRHAEVGADVCTTAHCQEWKRVDPIVAPEVFRAVSETWGIVAAFDGKLIDAFFFEHCDGHTRSAPDVHMPPVPYLQTVPCDCGFVALKGHGVGLCQRGAIVMARRGATFEVILKHYYCYVTLVASGRDLPNGTSMPAAPLTRPSVRPAHAPTPSKHAKTSSAPTHKGKTSHKPVSPQRPAPAKPDKPRASPPLKRKEPPPVPPPSLGSKQAADKPAERTALGAKPILPSPPSAPPPSVETAPRVATPPAAVELPPTPKVEQEQAPSAPPATVITPADAQARVSPPPQPTLEQPAVVEPQPPEVPAPVAPSEGSAAVVTETTPPLAIEPTMPTAFPAVAPAEGTPSAEILGPQEASAEGAAASAEIEDASRVEAAEPTEAVLPPHVAAAPQAGTETEVLAETGTHVELPPVPDYVAALNDPSLLAVSPLREPVETESLSEPISEVVPAPIDLSAAPTEDELESIGVSAPLIEETPVVQEAQPEPCEPDSLPEVTSPAPKTGKPMRVHIDHLPGERMIAGCLSTPGIMITVLDQRGNETLVMSGSAPHYGEGGFETVVEEDGCYVVWIDGEPIKLEVHANTAFIHII